MSTYYQDANTTILHGDCIETMRGMPENSVDSIVTDPPYGLGFMGKKWDDLPPGKEWAEQCLRVLKPGGHILAFGGTRTWHRLAVAIEDAGFEMRDSLAWLYGSGFPKHRAALKPAFEPVVMARKPFKGSLTANEAIHGTGALNIGATRIPGSVPSVPQPVYGVKVDGVTNFGSGEGRNGQMSQAVGGRWPANVLLDEHTAELLDEQSGNRPGFSTQRDLTANRNDDGLIYGRGLGVQSAGVREGYNDSGGASRFFYCAKASKSERPTVDGVAHATVKPLKLMRYLVRMVTPLGGTVLDPFAGSGTTIEAALIEGFNPIGIEQEAEYLPLIQHRINRANEGKP